MEETKLSKNQRTLLKMIEEVYEFDPGRKYYNLAEFPGITRHTTKVLIEKGFLELVNGPFGDGGPEYFKRTEKEWRV